MKIEDIKIEKLSKNENEALINYAKRLLGHSQCSYEIEQYHSTAFSLTRDEGHIYFSTVKKTLCVSFWYAYHKRIQAIDIPFSQFEDKSLFNKLIGLYHEWLKNIDDLVQNAALKSTVWVYTSNNGDGSVTPLLFSTQEDAQAHAEKDEERYCEDITKLTIYFDKNGKMIPVLYNEDDDESDEE